MIQKFETAGILGILLDKGRKKIPSSSVDNVVTTVIEASCHSLHGSVNVSDVSRILDMPYPTVQNFTECFKFLSLQNQGFALMAGRRLRGL